MMNRVLRVGLIVGEASGDLLGAALIEQLKKIYPDLTFEGVLGPRLQALGGKTLYESERLAVMGFVEPLKRLPELLRMRTNLCAHFIKNPPDVFIGVDAPDFTLGIEKKLKRYGIKTVHYVSPSVWAWRQGRIKTIKKAVDLMLVLFPFEADFYRQHQVPVAYVGHPMARDIALEGRQPVSMQTLAILPGSRHSEISHMTEPFLKTAFLLKQKFPHLRFISPMASPTIREHFLKIKETVAPDLEIELRDGQADEVLAISDCALITSGTATLQAMLHHCPMVVAYKTAAFNAWLIRKLYRQKYFALPNILCDKRVVEEYFQENVTSEQLSTSLEVLLENNTVREEVIRDFVRMHEILRGPAEDAGARAIQPLLA